MVTKEVVQEKGAGIPNWAAPSCSSSGETWEIIILHCLISLLRGRCQSNHFIRLNKKACVDVYWWLTFMKLWNGISIFSTGGPTIQLVSDASGSWGCGAFSGHEWF